MAIKKAVPAVYRTAYLRYGVETRRYFLPVRVAIGAGFQGNSTNYNHYSFFYQSFYLKIGKIIVKSSLHFAKKAKVVN